VRGWAFYDLECMGCGNVGLLGIWTEVHGADEVWNGEWDGFFGIVDRKTGPKEHTVHCGLCYSTNVKIAVREEETALQP
jgi:hypothetical protein